MLYWMDIPSLIDTQLEYKKLTDLPYIQANISKLQFLRFSLALKYTKPDIFIKIYSLTCFVAYSETFCIPAASILFANRSTLSVDTFILRSTFRVG